MGEIERDGGGSSGEGGDGKGEGGEGGGCKGEGDGAKGSGGESIAAHISSMMMYLTPRKSCTSLVYRGDPVAIRMSSRSMFVRGSGINEWYVRPPKRMQSDQRREGMSQASPAQVGTAQASTIAAYLCCRQQRRWAPSRHTRLRAPA